MDVGQGNMVLIQIPNSKTIVCDCNITEENKESIMDYLKNHLGNNTIDIFINTHRDADHMRGIKLLNKEFEINELWDGGVSGTTTNSDEYKEYMELRRDIGKEVESLKYWTFGDCTLRIMNGKNEYFNDANDQSLVIKLEYGNNGVLLTGDTSYKSWKEFILPNYSDKKIQSEILLASHHGSISFFDNPSDENYYFIKHLKKINPSMTIISLGDNNNHPHEKAVKLYNKYSNGYGKKKGKLLTTKEHKTITFEFNKDGSSSCKWGL
ncbi:MAG: MBL fold metallo-hydrolase [Candidatus Aenigmarchaeota archaeon]|nr:MBL fold metallo-hydrolase [Candidatus Aenigmarchaeota archaeon]